MSKTVTLDENKLKTEADQLFAGATPAQKKVAPVSVLRNDSNEPIAFNVILGNGTIENKGASIPPNGFAVVQTGGEINVMSDFANLYENVQETVSSELTTHAEAAIDRAGINNDVRASLTKLTATSKQRVDSYIKLPLDENQQPIDFVIMKPWGENRSMIPQNAKSGDVLVMNGQNGSLYFNSVSGTLGNFVHAQSGANITEELPTMKTASLATLEA